jgi:hypothetical protein
VSALSVHITSTVNCNIITILSSNLLFLLHNVSVLSTLCPPPTLGTFVLRSRPRLQPQHYRCYRVWTTSSRSIRISDTLAWFLQGLQLPGPSAHDLFCSAVQDLTNATKTLFDKESTVGALHPTGQVINTLTGALQELSAIYPKHTSPSKDINTSHAAPQAEHDQRVS